MINLFISQMMQFKNKWEEYGKYEMSNKMSFQEFEKYLELRYPEESKTNQASFYKNFYPQIK